MIRLTEVFLANESKMLIQAPILVNPLHIARVEIGGFTPNGSRIMLANGNQIEVAESLDTIASLCGVPSASAPAGEATP